MVRRIKWSLDAQNDRKSIFVYWNNRNKSRSYSKKLNEIIKGRLEILRDYPVIGHKTNNPNIRFLVIRDYLLFYYVETEEIIVLRIWDSRQDPLLTPFIKK